MQQPETREQTLGAGTVGSLMSLSYNRVSVLFSSTHKVTLFAPRSKHVNYCTPSFHL